MLWFFPHPTAPCVLCVCALSCIGCITDAFPATALKSPGHLPARIWHTKIINITWQKFYLFWLHCQHWKSQWFYFDLVVWCYSLHWYCSWVINFNLCTVRALWVKPLVISTWAKDRLYHNAGSLSMYHVYLVTLLNQQPCIVLQINKKLNICK